MDRSRVAVVIPALNESASIARVVTLVCQYGTPIVVDDGSTDGTAALAKEAGATVVTLPRSLGYDRAIDHGFQEASALGCTLIMTFDGDGQHDPTVIEGFLDRIEAGADVVIGIRPRKQRFAEQLFAWYTRWQFGISDPLCGMKAYRTEVYRALGHFDCYRSI